MAADCQSITTWVKKTRTRPPEPGSFRHRLLTHSSLRLYVRPIEWGPELLDHIDCDVQPKPTFVEDSGKSGAISVLENNRHVTNAFGALLGARVTRRKDEATRRLVDALIPRDHTILYASSLPPYLLFDGKPVASIRSHFLFRSTATSRPVFAYIDKTWLSDQRRNIWKHRPRKTINSAVERMVKLDFDPYISALLLSMAQNSCAFTSDDEIQVHVFSPSRNHKFLMQYSSNVSRQYLQKWDDSYKSSNCRITITQKKISLDRPNVIMLTFCNIERLYAYRPGTPLSLEKRKVMSDTTNSSDKLPAAKRLCPGSLLYSKLRPPTAS